MLFIDALIALVGNHVEDLDEKERSKLKEKIFNISNFDENKLDLYCNLMPFYDIKNITNSLTTTEDVSETEQAQINLEFQNEVKRMLEREKKWRSNLILTNLKSQTNERT
ncbi:hypothetical protein SDC49_21895 [Lactobacillus sp. R2/2]|nr:hypothetical protein [Lactobacillus sp. R2/2]